jgi:membrane-associated phospholipid phosphatase
MKLPPLWKPGLVWLLVLGPLFFLSYGFANHHAASAAVVPSIVFDWERHIPLWPWTILPYWSIDLFYGLSLLICATRLELKRQGLRLLTAQLICVACFLLFPLKFSTPRPAVEGWAGQLFDALAGFDLPYNQAPSLHIVLLLILWDFYRQRLHGPWKGVLHVWSALIGVSVLTTFQHHFIDIPTGLLAGSLCLWMWPLEGERPVWQWSVSAQRRRIALMYGLGAFACVLLAGLGRAWWWFYWPAASLTLVALCYAALGEQGFQKRVNGHHSMAARLLFWPYRMGAWLNARAWTLGLPRSAQVGDRDVWLGRLPLPWDGDHHRFDQVVDVTAELGFHHPGARSHGWLDLTEPSPEHLLNAARSVELASREGPVLVSCALGFSRSSAVVATWLCVYGHCSSVDEAIALLRQARPQVVLKPVLVAVIEQAVSESRSPA